MLFIACYSAVSIFGAWMYATYTLLSMHEIGQNQHEKGGGLILHHGRILRILWYMCNVGHLCTPGDIEPNSSFGPTFYHKL